MNFQLCLLIASMVTGLVYLLDLIFWQKKRAQEQKPNQIIELSRSFFPVFFLVLILRSFFAEPFRIPSGSLEPTLLVGDFLVVNKYIYGLRLPGLEKKIWSITDPKRGDIVIFRWPPNPKFDFIKRVVGIPGDHVVYHQKILTINDQIVNQKFIEYTIDEYSGAAVAKYQEDLSGVVHEIFVHTDLPAHDFDVVVPAGSYFVMGDNRDDSADSRYWGFLADEYLRGKAVLTWMSWNGKSGGIRFSRIGQWIH